MDGLGVGVVQSHTIMVQFLGPSHKDSLSCEVTMLRQILAMRRDQLHYCSLGRFLFKHKYMYMNNLFSSLLAFNSCLISFVAWFLSYLARLISFLGFVLLLLTCFVSSLISCSLSFYCICRVWQKSKCYK